MNSEKWFGISDLALLLLPVCILYSGSAWGVVGFACFLVVFIITRNKATNMKLAESLGLVEASRIETVQATLKDVSYIDNYLHSLGYRPVYGATAKLRTDTTNDRKNVLVSFAVGKTPFWLSEFRGVGCNTGLIYVKDDLAIAFLGGLSESCLVFEKL